MSLLDNTIDTLRGGDPGAMLTTAIGAYATSKGLFDSRSEKTGYKGKVEKNTPIRERLELPDDPDRRAGEYGRRYFTDTEYVRNPTSSSGRVAQEEEIDASAQVLASTATPGATYGTRRILGDVVPDVQISTDQVIGDTVVDEADQEAGKTYTQEGDSVGAGYEILKPDIYQADGAYEGGYLVEEESLRNPARNYTAAGREILLGSDEEGGYDATRIYGDTGYEELTPSQRVEGNQYTDDGFQIYDTDRYDAEKNYNAGGYEITNPARYYTNLYESTEAIADQKTALEDVNTATAEAAQAARGSFAVGGLAQFASPYDEEKEKDSAKFNMGGGVMQLGGGRYLDGMTDGMADKVPSSIDGVQPAALSDGEFVIPADVVSHLGNGSSNAGAKVLDDMMSNVRQERTGNSKQGKQIDPRQVMAQGGLAGYAHGGPVQKFQDGGLAAEPLNVEPMNNDGGLTAEPINVEPMNTATGDGSGGASDALSTGDFESQETGDEQSLAGWVGDYVTDFLGDAQGLADAGYQEYRGPLTAGESDIQKQAFGSAMNMDTSGAGLGSFGNLAQTTTYNQDGSVDVMGRDSYMNPYVQDSLAPQLRIAQEEADRQMAAQNVAAAQSGAFGGSRNAIMNAMLQRDSAQQQADITAQGYNTAFDNAQNAFGADRDFGLAALQTQTDMGGIQRDIEAEGVAADMAQFEDERDYQYRMPQWLHSLTQGLPVSSSNTSYSEPSRLSQMGANIDATGQIISYGADLFGLGGDNTGSGSS